MNRYPDRIIILEPYGGNPYEEPTYNVVYRGRCRCFMDKKSVMHVNKVMESDYQVVIPDTKMPDIGENYKVGIHQHTSSAEREWNLVGYVKDFARYDRVCNLYFQMVKDSQIEEDVPNVALEQE